MKRTVLVLAMLATGCDYNRTINMAAPTGSVLVESCASGETSIRNTTSTKATYEGRHRGRPEPVETVTVPSQSSACVSVALDWKQVQ